MPKRKLTSEEDSEPQRRRSVRLQKVEEVATSSAVPKAEVEGDRLKFSTKKPTLKTKKATEKEVLSGKKLEPAKDAQLTGTTVNGSKKKSKTSSNTTASASDGADGDRNYWLMKAEPESRYENGVDVKFSIDDLAAKSEPEPWDGIRAYAARNNLRAMKKGDLAFFYHSNCKEPGIVGTMEIVQEHSPDLSAHDPKAPYYDPSSKPSNPKWSVVHVKFRSKFAVPIGLKELREMGGPGKPLENMQMLKQSRLSVSKVSAAEWEYLMGVAEQKASQQ
ncbi:hypothetical protein C8A03DRAFT_14791 [Achaetomium macrosporum]|uniref:Thymocyte nuclear protein 1 n=1 Tax=Achaetomium macrosporum TaxID=79813 RepID=A0AAN7CD41_9PEZI|nr:hypothetical protein C8A03DRAFT_14791 [Achaetomium macrosporum]